MQKKKKEKTEKEKKPTPQCRSETARTLQKGKDGRNTVDGKVTSCYDLPKDGKWRTTVRAVIRKGVN